MFLSFCREMSVKLKGKIKHVNRNYVKKKNFPFLFSQLSSIGFHMDSSRISKSWKTTSLSTPSCQLSFAQLSPFLSCVGQLARYGTSEYTCIIHNEPRITMAVRFRPHNKNRIMQDPVGLYPKNIVQLYQNSVQVAHYMHLPLSIFYIMITQGAPKI